MLVPGSRLSGLDRTQRGHDTQSLRCPWPVPAASRGHGTRGTRHSWYHGSNASGRTGRGTPATPNPAMVRRRSRSVRERFHPPAASCCRTRDATRGTSVHAGHKSFNISTLPDSLVGSRGRRGERGDRPDHREDEEDRNDLPCRRSARDPPQRRDSRVSRRPAFHPEATDRRSNSVPGLDPFRATQASSVSNATMSRDSAPISTPIRWVTHPGARYLSA